jgi:uncharacterized protein involved in outer membrane biogenesis
LADLYLLTGLAMPNTPPYRIAGGLRRTGNLYVFRNFSGRVGDSDLGGTLNIDVSGERPYMKGELRSRRLDFDDLGTLLGAPPSTAPGETASPEQKKEAAVLIAEQRLFPDAPLKVERVRAMDADVRYEAESVNARGLPLTKVVIGVDLHGGVLDLHPVSFNMKQGALSGRARIDARKNVPDVNIDMALNNARLEQFFATGGDPPVAGMVEGRAKLHGSGLSVHDALGTSDGTVAVAIPNGEMRKAFAELLGINVASGLGLLLSGDDSKTDIRCSVADFHARNGVLALDTMVFDTGPVLATGKGTVDLRNETLDIRLEGHPKKPELIRLMAPITLTGKLRSPQVGIEAGKAIAQAGIAGVLATFLSPLAAVLPFLSPGLAKDANCGQLIAQARADGVPVADSAAPAAAKSAPVRR